MSEMNAAQKMVLREERKRLGAILVGDLHDEFARADALKQKLVPIVYAHPDGISSIYHRIAHPFVGAYGMAKDGLGVGRVEAVLNSFEGCLLRIEGFEDQIEEELRPSSLVREITDKISAFIKQNPEIFTP